MTTVGSHSFASLEDVTLVAVTGVAIGPTVDALHASMRQASFAQVLLLSDQPPPPDADPAIQWRRIEPLRSRNDYSRFMLRSLADEIDTGHALCVQWDGFILDGKAWDPAFLEFDYVGAPWPHFHDNHNVGNGGFSLRSKRLLEACRDLPIGGAEAEDVVISRLCRPLLERRGIRFAPEAVARSFSYERSPPTGREFGFHGSFNLVKQLARDEAVRLFRGLEPQLLARNERLELLRWALTHARWKLALTMFARLA